ncbi:hypothetical protein ABT160_25485 [Streptomyces sp. NPDC001941]|uniref:hypothetical protein n=1 Tax=Streptomyces sp. NPDC001941 TaxID=3154659 RepID=UPI00332CA02D
MTADTDPAPALKALLKDLLRGTGLTQQSYARRSGLNPTQLSRLINLHQVPQTEFLHRLIDTADQGPGGPVEREVRERADGLLLALVAQRHPERRYEEETRRRDHAEVRRRAEDLQARLDACERDLAAATARAEQLRTERRQLRADRSRAQQKLDVSLTTVRKLNKQLDAALAAPRSHQEVREAVRRRWDADPSDRCQDLLLPAATALAPLEALHLLVWLWSTPHDAFRTDGTGQVFLEDFLRCRSAADVSQLGTALLVDAVPGHPRQWAEHLLTGLGRRRPLPELLAQRDDWTADESVPWTEYWDRHWLTGWMGGDRPLHERLAVFDPAMEDACPGIARRAADALRTVVRPADAAEMLLALAESGHPYAEAVALVHFDPDWGPLQDPEPVTTEFWLRLCRPYGRVEAQAAVMRAACQALRAEEVAATLAWLHRWVWEARLDETVLDTFLTAVCGDAATARTVRERLRDGIDPGRAAVAERLGELVPDRDPPGTG